MAIHLVISDAPVLLEGAIKIHKFSVKLSKLADLQKIKKHDNYLLSFWSDYWQFFECCDLPAESGRKLFGAVALS